MKVGELIVDLETSLVKFNKGITTAQGRLTQFGQNISRMGRGISIAGGAITAAFGLIAKTGLTTFAGVNQQLKETKNIIGPVGTSFKQLDKIVNDLGISTKFTQKALADGLRQIASAGIKQETQMRSVLASATDLASAIGTDLNTAISHTLGATEAFGEELGGTAGAVDLMTNLVRSARIESDGLGDILKYATGTVKAFNGDIKDAMAAIAGYTQITGSAQQASVFFRQSMAQLAKQSGKQKQVLDELGLTFQDINPEVHSIIDVIKTLRDANISGAQATQLLGVRAMSFIKVVEQVIPQVEKVRDALDEKGSAARLASDNLKTLNGDYVLMTSSAEALWKQIGEALSPAFRELFQDLKEVIDNAIEFVKANNKLIASVIIAGIKIGLLVTALGALLTTAGMVIVAIPKISVALTVLGTAATGVGTALLGMKLSLGAMAGALTVSVVAISTAIKTINDLIKKIRELKKANDEARDAEALAAEKRKEQFRIYKEGFELAKTYSVEHLQSLKDEALAYDTAKAIAQAYYTSAVDGSLNLSQEERQRRIEVGDAYTAFYTRIRMEQEKSAQNTLGMTKKDLLNQDRLRRQFAAYRRQEARKTAQKIMGYENSIIELMVTNITSMKNLWKAFGDFVIKEVLRKIIKEIGIAKLAAKGITTALGFIGGGIGTILGIGAQHGANFVVPSGFPNDSFLMGATSGEHVAITPGGKPDTTGALSLTVQNNIGNVSSDNVDSLLEQITEATKDGTSQAIEMVKQINLKNNQFGDEV